jgi:NAD(P)-dependent dehydrogenase (short-subunit alcohol dehydrogenase family)
MTTTTIINLENTVRQCEALGVDPLAQGCDITNPAAVVPAIAESFSRFELIRTEKRFGKIDVLVNNAGVNSRRPFHMMKFDEFWRVVEVDFKAVDFLSLVISR